MKISQWGFWLIQNDPDGVVSLPVRIPIAPAPWTLKVPDVEEADREPQHPIHLHGHDFVVVGRSPDATPASQTRYVYNPSTDGPNLKSNNPVRRDVTMLPARGWLVLAFKTDNPGAWLMHCHIAWHVSGGLAVDFLERPNDFKNGVSASDKAAFNQNCAAWDAYYPSADPFKQQDSGL